MTRRKRQAEGPVRLSDEEIETLRAVYEDGLTLPEGERRRRGLGYTGLARKFGIPRTTLQYYVSYLRRC